MGQSPISWPEIEAYNRCRAFGALGPWELDLICAIDDATLAVWAKERSKGANEPETMIDAGNASAVKAMFRGLAAQKATE